MLSRRTGRQRSQDAIARPSMTATLTRLKLNTIDRRLWLSGALLVAIALAFWLGSRYPALDEKALMGGETELAALGFDTLLEPDESAPLLEQVAVNSVNWLYTNRQGMTFGILLAAALLTLLALVSTPVFKSRLANSFVGVLVGSPLGVCVNCAAPIAYGMAGAGLRTETTLAMMLSSPTLNVIVLTMLFALFPPYVAAIKIGLTLLVLLAGIPLLTRLLPPPAAADLANRPTPRPFGISAPAAPLPGETGAGGWPGALRWTAVAYTRNLWFIVKHTVPLMVLAGALGALAVTLLPLDTLVELLPVHGKLLLLVGLAAVALLGTFLPVPMAFDIILAAILLEAGLPVSYVVVLLFTLGIFSIYAFTIVWQALSRAAALLLFAGIVGTGLVAGVLGHEGNQWNEARERQLFLATFNAAAVAGPREMWYEGAAPEAAETLLPALAETAVAFEPLSGDFPAGIALDSAPFIPSNVGGPHRFTRLLGDEIGLDAPYNYWVGRGTSPFMEFRGIAAGDIHGDGWPDILVTSETGIHLFANRGDGRFTPQALPLEELDRHLTADFAGDRERRFVGNAAIVDIDGDGLSDIFLSAHRRGNFIFFNEDGRFPADRVRPLPNILGAMMSSATAFGDVDADGDVDIVLGNWSLGPDGPVGVPGSQNGILLQNDGAFVLAPLPGRPGETLSMLLTDFTADGRIDLIVGNDFMVPDFYYVGDGAGGFTPLTVADGIIPHTAGTTMSVHTADVDNDLRPEIYVAQISPNQEDESLSVPIGVVCAELAGSAHANFCRESRAIQEEISRAWATRDATGCLRRLPVEWRVDCLAFQLRSYTRTPAEECAWLPDGWEVFRDPCLRRTQPRALTTEAEMAVELPQIAGNVLLAADGNGGFYERGVEMGIDKTDWAWNAKFADVNNDGWQDLFVVNGWFLRQIRAPNFFYYNRGGERFEEAGEAVGLRSYFDTSAYTYVDYDRDGDLDIIAAPVVGPLFVYRNDGAVGESVAISLVDEQGNRTGLGSVVTIGYGDGSRQMREIQAGGGFISYDPPVAHFGLGANVAVDWIEVRWSTGETIRLDGPFPAGRHYVVQRQARP